MSNEIQINQIYDLDNPLIINGLIELLIDCVHEGASIGFLYPLTPYRAKTYWQNIAASVANKHKILLIAQTQDSSILGSVQLQIHLPENQPHRANVEKLMVLSKHRKSGIGRALMDAVEHFASIAGKTLLVLDTATGSEAEHLYSKLGWQPVGMIPNYAKWPDGQMTSTTFFYKQISA